MKISYYFDFLSPYSYLSWSWVREMHISGRAQFEFIPVVLGKLISLYETKGPAQIDPKRNYLYKDCLRKAHLREIPFNMPKKLPFNSLGALRFALKGVAEKEQFRVIDSIFMAGWRDGRDLGEPEVLLDILREEGLYSDEFISRSEAKDARRELKGNVARALETGVFGVPTFVAGSEFFWGDDSTEHIDRLLSGNDYYDKEKYIVFEKGFPFI